MSAVDIVFIAGTIFVLIIGALIATTFLTEFKDSDIVVDSFPTNAKTALDQGEAALYGFDGIILFFFVGLAVVSIASAALVNVNPIFFVGAFIVNLIMVVISTIFNDIFLVVAANPTIAPIANSFPIMTTMMANFPVLIMVVSTLIAIATFAKGSGGGQFA